MRRRHIAALSCVALFSCRPRTPTPDPAASGVTVDVGPVTPSESAYRVVDRPSASQLASLQGPRRPATCTPVAVPPPVGPFFGRGWTRYERCDGVLFTVSESDSDELGAFSSTLSFGPPYSGTWACESGHTPCLTLDRELWVRRSADGSIVEFTCHTRQRRLDRRARARARWPCAEGDVPPPPPLHLESSCAP